MYVHMVIKIFYLKRNFRQTHGTTDIKTKDRHAQILLAFHRLFPCVELLPMIYVITTCHAPHGKWYH